MSTNYEYDPESAGKADDVASRIDTNGPYVGQFKLAHTIKSERTGTEGIHFEFNSPGGGSASFDVYTRKEDGTPTFGWNQVQAMMTVLGLRGLRSVLGKFEQYDFDAGKRVEVEGEIFPELCSKDIGLVLQKELYTKNDDKEGFRMNLYGIFHPVSRLTASELKDRKTQPEKIEKMLRGLKTKDSRRAVTAEPAQPAVGAGEGGY
jgi:single-strand DNA-binding protein